MLMVCKCLFVHFFFILKTESVTFGVKSASPPHICKIPWPGYAVTYFEKPCSKLDPVFSGVYLAHHVGKICNVEWSGGFWFRPSHCWLSPSCLANVNTTTYRQQGVNENIPACYPFVNGSQLVFDLLGITAKTNKGRLKGFKAVGWCDFFFLLTAHLAQQVSDSDLKSEVKPELIDGPL